MEEVAVGKEAAHDTAGVSLSATITGGVEMADTSVAVIKEAGPDTALSTVVTVGVKLTDTSLAVIKKLA